MSTKPITDEDFETQVLKSEQPVLVDFWAEWCGPCKSLGPKLEEVSEKLGEKVRILKLDVDNNPDSPAKYGVKGIPTLMLFKNGELVDQAVGNVSKEDIIKLIETNT